MVSLGSLVSVVLYLIVGGLIVWLLLWLISYCGLPQPFDKIARIVVVVFAVLIIISVLLSLTGNPIIRIGP